MKYSNFFNYFVVILLSFIPYFSSSVLAETTEVTVNKLDNNLLSKDVLQAKIDALSERKSLDEAVKSRLLATYQAAQDELSNLAIFKEKNQTFKKAIQETPELIKKIQQDINQALEKKTEPKKEEFENIPIEELTQRLVIEQGKVFHLDELIQQLENELTEQNDRPNLIRQEILKAKQELENAQKGTKGISSNIEQSKLDIDAQQIYFAIQVESKTAELAMLDVETASYSLRLEYLKKRLQLLNLQKNALVPLINTIQTVLTKLQQQQDKNKQKELNQAEKDLADKPEVIQSAMRKSIEYNQELQAITNKIRIYQDKKINAETRIKEMDTSFSSTKKMIDLADISPAIGKVLHDQRRNLIKTEQFISRIESIKDETALINLKELQVEEQIRKLTDIDKYLKNEMDKVNKKLSMPERMMIQAELRVLLNEQNKILTELSISYNDYLRALGDFDFARQQEKNKVDKYSLYLDEHLLWVRSSAAIGTHIIAELYHTVQWLLSPSNWYVLLKNALYSPIKKPVFSFFALLNIIVLLSIRKWLKQRLVFVSNKIGKIYGDRFYFTVEAILYTILFITPLPLTIGYIGWFLTQNISVDNFTQAIGFGLRRAALVWFFLQLLYQLFEPKQGIMLQHFQWQESNVKLIRSQLAWLRWVSIPCSFLVKATLESEQPVYSDSLGRLAFVINVIIVVFLLKRILNPKNGITQYTILHCPQSWIAKLRYLIYAVAFSPLIIIGYSFLGYHLSALEVQQKWTITLWTFTIMVILYEMVIRWLNMMNQTLAIKNLQHHRVESKMVDVEARDFVEETEIDIPKINAQTIKIMNVVFCFSFIIGFWIIWRTIFPAFSFLENIQLWQNKIIIDGKESYQYITSVNLLLAGVYLFIAIVSVRNFSGLLELVVFQRITITAGSRYAINQLVKYLLIMISFFAITNELGFSWSQVQWLVAAFSVGLGFGLQEIFANFVSGLILLFERPIRVGDTITIADVSGRVSQIHMRATTLIDFDQKELVVPNKTFLTTQLTNWSLSDTVTRLVIPVGIAYDSDVELAHQVMLDVVNSTPFILKEPEPSVLLIGFADSALEFSIRVFVGEHINRMPVTHDLHCRLINALREHHIEIPFPQRDIHVRSVTSEWNARSDV